MTQTSGESLGLSLSVEIFWDRSRFPGEQKMNLLRLSLSLLRRDWRAGEWRVLLLALVLAVGSLATVGLFADRVRQALQQQAQSLIGADLRITSTRPFSPSYRAMAQQRNLRVVQSRTFPSMVSHREQVLLSEIQSA